MNANDHVARFHAHLGCETCHHGTHRDGSCPQCDAEGRCPFCGLAECSSSFYDDDCLAVDFAREYPCRGCGKKTLSLADEVGIEADHAIGPVPARTIEDFYHGLREQGYCLGDCAEIHHLSDRAHARDMEMLRQPDESQDEDDACRPRPGDVVTRRPSERSLSALSFPEDGDAEATEVVGTVLRLEGDICVLEEVIPGTGDHDSFIWRDHDGVNKLYNWPGKGAG